MKEVGLIKGRHALPPQVTEYIYESSITSDHLVDDEWLYQTAKNALLRLDVHKEVMIYVTGLTQALIATLNACRANGVKVYLVHYDREKKSWWTQGVK